MHTGARLSCCLVLAVTAGCAGTNDPDSTAETTDATTTPTTAMTTTATATSTTSSTATTTDTTTPGTVPAPPEDSDPAFPIDVFAEISDRPVPSDLALRFQSVLDDMAAGGGMAAVVSTPAGTWSGAAGMASDEREMHVDDQFAIASVTKSIVAAQVMQLVDAGELSLDDPASEHLPDLDFDTNHATVRDLLGMHSGIPDYEPALWEQLPTDPLHRWTPDELLGLVGESRTAAGTTFDYSSTNYVLLGLIIEQLRHRPLGDVLRHGILDVDGTERLVYQPDEQPTEPLAMPDGESTDALAAGGGYLPSLAGVTAGGPAIAMASDAPSLARWWQALCAGTLISERSLTAMATRRDGYGLGTYNPAGPYANAVGHTGEHHGYVAWAGCLPDQAAVVVVLSNHVVEDVGAIARPLVTALETGAASSG